MTDCACMTETDPLDPTGPERVLTHASSCPLHPEYEPEPTLTRVADTAHGLPCYEVAVDGVVIGTVFRKRTSWSRKPRGRRYVTSRGTSDRYWSYLVAGADPFAWNPTIDTRREAVDRLIREAART